MGDDRRRGVPVGGIHADLDAVRDEDLQRGPERRFGQRVRVAADEEGAVRALRRAVAADRLGHRDDVGLVEGAVQRRPAVTGRPEGDPLRGIGGIGADVVVGAEQPIEVDQDGWICREPGALAVRHRSMVPYRPGRHARPARLSSSMDYRRMPIEAESPEQFGYDRIRFNLAESSVADTPLRDLDVSLDDLVLLYGDHLGRPGLRAAIAAGAAGVGPDDVLVTPGAAAALFIVATTLLKAGDHVVVARPNYATNLETPFAIGADISYLDLRYEGGWAVDPDRVASLMTPATKLVSITNPHNPTGQVIPEATVRGDRGPRRSPSAGTAARGRDVSGDDIRRPAAGRGDALGAGHQRVVAVEGRRAAWHPHRLAGDPRRGSAGTLPGAPRNRSSSRTRSSTRRSRRSRWRDEPSGW